MLDPLHTLVPYRNCGPFVWAIVEHGNPAERWEPDLLETMAWEAVRTMSNPEIVLGARSADAQTVEELKRFAGQVLMPYEAEIEERTQALVPYPGSHLIARQQNLARGVRIDDPVCQALRVWGVDPALNAVVRYLRKRLAGNSFGFRPPCPLTASMDLPDEVKKAIAKHTKGA